MGLGADVFVLLSVSYYQSQSEHAEQGVIGTYILILEKKQIVVTFDCTLQYAHDAQYILFNLNIF